MTFVGVVRWGVQWWEAPLDWAVTFPVYLQVCRYIAWKRFGGVAPQPWRWWYARKERQAEEQLRIAQLSPMDRYTWHVERSAKFARIAARLAIFGGILSVSSFLIRIVAHYLRK